jgi:predicted glycoside hydrolase/deacetylase ChbG (UPF0249 family)
MNIILHSDDLGITAGATRHILSAWDAGALDGFSIIANGEALDTVRQELKKHPERPARIAVHFNLTEKAPSAPAREVSMLLGPDGMFRHSFGSLFVKWLLSSRSDWSALLRQVEIECRAQISTVRAASGGRGVHAIDGHNHVHMIPGIFSAVAGAARHEGVPEIRISREPFYVADPVRDLLRPFWWVNLVKHALLRWLSRRAVPVTATHALQFPQYMIGILYTGHMNRRRAERGIAAAAALDASAVEVVFHVGQSEDTESARWAGSRSYASFHLSKSRTIEYEELMSWRHEKNNSRAAT